MRSEQGSRVSSGQFRSILLSICVLQIRPWIISLNIPSPPTHTTLHGSQPSVMSPDQCGLDCNTSSVWTLTRQTSSALPPSSGDPLHDWRTRSLWQQQQHCLSKLQKKKKGPGSDSGRTNQWRACGCQPVQTAVRPLAHRCVCPFSCRCRGWCRPAGVWVCWLRETRSTRLFCSSHECAACMRVGFKSYWSLQAVLWCCWPTADTGPRPDRWRWPQRTASGGADTSPHTTLKWKGDAHDQNWFSVLILCWNLIIFNLNWKKKAESESLTS